MLLQDFLGLVDRAAHAVGGGGEHDLRAQRLEQSAALEHMRFGHGQDQLVTLGGADERQGDAGVAAGGFDDDGVLVDLPVALAGFDHRHADAVFHARQRVEELALGEHGRVILGDKAVEPHQRRAADGFGDVVEDPSLGFQRHGFLQVVRFVG